MQKNNTPNEISEQVCKFKVHAKRFFDDCESSGISIRHAATLGKIKFWMAEQTIARIGGGK